MTASDLKNDPTDDREQRLRKLWNRSKHFDEDLADPDKSLPEITAPVWLTNEQIKSRTAWLSFVELHTILVNLIDALEFYAEGLPQKVVEMRKTGRA